MMLGAHVTPADYLARIAEVQGELDLKETEALADAVHGAYERGNFVFICGNGGSGSNASHLCEDLGKSSLTRDKFTDDSVKRLKVLSLTDNTPYILAWGNDEGFDRIFVEQLKNLAGPGDVLIAISGSGNSENILQAVAWANKHGMETFGVTGFTGGKLRVLARNNVHVPCDDMGVVECVHLQLFHWVLDDLHGRINEVGRYAPRRELRKAA